MSQFSDKGNLLKCKGSLKRLFVVTKKNGGIPKRSGVDCKLQAVMVRKCEKMNKVNISHEKQGIIQNEHKSEKKLSLLSICCLLLQTILRPCVYYNKSHLRIIEKVQSRAMSWIYGYQKLIFRN